ncbi:MAG TPA: molecular chaperone DnaJ, partial [Cyanobacteria bacterium UBA11372]|nr:molecular chaperone DnaJ [Cyanobacteria bacterium UBA11372]
MRCVNTIPGHANWVFSVAISPHGQILASGSRDRTIKIWHLKTGQLLHTLIGDTKWVRCLAFTPDGKTLVSGGDDGKLNIWQ